jgi:hypothetical protein
MKWIKLFETFDIGEEPYKDISKDQIGVAVTPDGPALTVTDDIFDDIINMGNDNINRLKLFFDKWISIKVRSVEHSEKPIECGGEIRSMFNPNGYRVDVYSFKVKLFFPKPFFGHSGYDEFYINEYEDGWFMVMSDHAVYLCDQLSGVEKLFRDKYLQYYKSKF